jgi:hypothetical protein
VSERKVMVVTLATDDIVFLLEQWGVLHGHQPPFTGGMRGVDRRMPPDDVPGTGRRTASDGSVNPRCGGPVTSSRVVSEPHS